MYTNEESGTARNGPLYDTEGRWASMQSKFIPDQLALAWAAGFFDGEGHVSARNNGSGRAWRPIVQIAQTELTTLERFQKAVGGLGTIIGPVQYKDKWKPVWHFKALSFEHCQAIIAMLWPYLSAPKRVDAKQAMNNLQAWQKEKHSTCRRGLHLYSEVGRTKSGSCAECNRINLERRKTPRTSNMYSIGL